MISRTSANVLAALALAFSAPMRATFSIYSSLERISRIRSRIGGAEVVDIFGQLLLQVAIADFAVVVFLVEVIVSIFCRYDIHHGKEVGNRFGLHAVRLCWAGIGYCLHYLFLIAFSSSIR